MTAITAGSSHTCARDSERERRVLGCQTRYGQIGRRDDDRPTNLYRGDGLVSNVVEMAVGDDHTCAITAAGSVMCWGDNGSGRARRRHDDSAADANAQSLGSRARRPR